MWDGIVSPRADVLVLGLGPGGLGILRSLQGCDDIRKYGVTFNPLTEKGRLTRLCSVLSWPDPRSDEDGFAASLIRWAEQREKVIVFPTRDDEVFWLAEHADILPPNILYYRNYCGQVNRLANKFLATELAEACGLKVPHSVDIAENIPVTTDFVFPGIIKPSSVVPRDFPHKNLIVENSEKLKDILDMYPSLLNASILQEYIPGEDDRMYECNILVGQSGTTLASVEFRKLRQYPVGRGLASFGHTFADKKLCQISEKLMKTAGIRGPVNFEFKKDSRDERLVFIEANVRMPAYSSIYSCTGVNLTQIYVDDLLGESRSDQHNNDAKICCWMHEDLDAANVLTRKVDIGIAEWLGYLMKTDAFAFWYKDDPVPGIVNFYQFIRNSLNRMSRILRGRGET